MSPARARAARVFGWLGIVVGAWGLLVAGRFAFATSKGAGILKLVHVSSLGALVIVTLGLLTLVAARRRSRGLVVAVGTAYCVAAAWTLLRTGMSGNPLGGRANTLAMFLGMGAGLLALAWSPEPSPGDPGGER